MKYIKIMVLGLACGMPIQASDGKNNLKLCVAAGCAAGLFAGVGSAYVFSRLQKPTVPAPTPKAADLGDAARFLQTATDEITALKSRVMQLEKAFDDDFSQTEPHEASSAAPRSHRGSHSPSAVLPLAALGVAANASETRALRAGSMHSDEDSISDIAATAPVRQPALRARRSAVVDSSLNGAAGVGQVPAVLDSLLARNSEQH